MRRLYRLWRKTRLWTRPGPGAPGSNEVMRWLMADLITVNEARYRMGNALIEDGDIYWSEYKENFPLLNERHFDGD